MSLVAVECCVEIMNNYIFVLSSLFLVGCLGLALKPSPIYGGLGLIVSGFVGCLMVQVMDFGKCWERMVAMDSCILILGP